MAIFTRFLPGPKAGARSDNIEEAANWQRSTSLFKPAPLEYDLVAQLTYMSALATANVGRENLFQKTAELGYTTSGYFHRVHLVAQRLNYDYARACQLVADSTENEIVRSLLLRFSSSLSSGEPETVFLARETEIELDKYSRKYERDLESLRKWTDAYVALMVSVTLVVVVSLVSMMIYSVGTAFILGLAAVMIGIAVLGDWIIYRTSPVEPKTHKRANKSKTQDQMFSVARDPAARGRRARRRRRARVQHRRRHGGWRHRGRASRRHGVHRRPHASTSTTATSRRSCARWAPSSARSARRSRKAWSASTSARSRRWNRACGGCTCVSAPASGPISAGIASSRRPAASWSTGRWAPSGTRSSSAATRTLSATCRRMFALKISLLRENRKLVSQTFMYLMVPLHAVLIAILLFVTEVMVVFAAAAQQHPDASDRQHRSERPRAAWMSQRAGVRVAEHRVHPRVRARRDDRADHRRHVVAARHVRRPPPQGLAVRGRDAGDVRRVVDDRPAHRRRPVPERVGWHIAATRCRRHPATP